MQLYLLAKITSKEGWIWSTRLHMNLLVIPFLITFATFRTLYNNLRIFTPMRAFFIQCCMLVYRQKRYILVFFRILYMDMRFFLPFMWDFRDFGCLVSKRQCSTLHLYITSFPSPCSLFRGKVKILNRSSNTLCNKKKY